MLKMTTQSRKKILVIGSGWEQYALFEKIKKSGHKIIATHPNTKADSFKLADITYVKDSRDIRAHMIIAETHNVDAVITDNCDYSLYTASVVALKLRLPFASVKSALYSNDKFSQREACEKSEVLQPEFYKVRTPQDAIEAANKIGYPVVIKPVDSRGTFGVTIVNDQKKLVDAYFDAVSYSPSLTLICEKFIEGELVTVDGFCFSNGHQSITVASRKFAKGKKPVTKSVSYPSKHNDELKSCLLKNHQLVVEVLGYDFGHTHGEYFVTKNKEIYLVECANRGAGVYTSSTINPLVTGIDLNEIFLNQALGCDDFQIDHEKYTYMCRAAILSFLDFEVGKVIKTINIDEVKKLNFVRQFRTIYEEKQMVESIENCASRHAMLVIDGSDINELSHNFDIFQSTLKVRYY
jgi:biotin carboxylase